MTKTRWISIIVLIIMMMSQISAFADSGLVEVDVRVSDNKIYFDNKVYNNGELECPFVYHKDVLYFPLASNAINAIGFALVIDENDDAIVLSPMPSNDQVNLPKGNENPAAKQKAQVQEVVVKIGNKGLDIGNYPVISCNDLFYVPLTLGVLKQLDIYVSFDEAGDLHISSLSKKAVLASVEKANDKAEAASAAQNFEAYIDKLIAIVKKANPSLSNEYAERIVRSVVKESRAQGIDETWILAMIWQESHFEYDLQGSGAVGLMQIMVSTGKRMGLTKSDLLTPEKSIKAGVGYVKAQYDRFGSMEKAISAYNKGPAAVASGNYKSTHLTRVINYREQILKMLK